MTNYVVLDFASFDDFKTYVEALPTTTDFTWGYSQERGYIVVVG